jgi:hypothetical protein
MSLGLIIFRCFMAARRQTIKNYLQIDPALRGISRSQ